MWRLVAGAAVGFAVLAASGAFAEDRRPGWLGGDPEPTGLAGTWSSVEDTLDLLLTLEADGHGTAMAFDHRTGESSAIVLDWAEDGDHLRTTAAGEPEQRYRLERIDADAFRLAGGDLGLDTQLYRRVEPPAAGEIPAAWFVGTWEGRSGLQWLVLTLGADGRQTSTLGDGPTDAGSWHAVPGQLVLHDDGASAIGYRAEVPAGGELILSGGNLGNHRLFLSRRAMPTPGDPLAGQFVGGDLVLVLERLPSGATAASGFLRGAPVAWETRLTDDDTLILSDPGGADEQQAIAYYNGLALGNGYSSTWLEKQAERPLPLPDGLEGEWMHADWDGSSSAYAFLADGRYVATYASTVRGEPLVTDGTYARDGGRLVLDPECEAPADYVLAQAGPQLLLGATLPNATTYHFVPDSPATIAAMMAERDAAWATENAAWEARLALAPAAAGDPVRPTAEVPVDPTPEDVFADATAFAAPQVYLWQSDYSYVQMQGEPGLLYSVTNAELVFNQSLAARIDWTRGQYRDSVKLFLYPNGRMFTRVESYVAAPVRTGAVIPTVTTAWTRYRIEDDRVVGDDDVIELLHGRRRARSGELCLDNVAWAAEGLGPSP